MNGNGGISIHAPARGATYGLCHFHVRLPISIHAPTRGATQLQCHNQQPHKHFNPRAHEGRDWPCPRPTWPCRYFNPRAHEGRDVQGPFFPAAGHDFNPRAHEGRDHAGQRLAQE